MKNILKRGTSLLLVVAMLLSFAVVVGATDTELTKNAHVKIWADTVALKAGETAYVPIYVDIDDKYGIGVLDFTVYADSGVTVDEVVKSIRATRQFGSMDQEDANVVFTGDSAYNGGKLVSWTSDKTLVTKENGQPAIACWAKVTASQDVSAKGYGVYIGEGKTQNFLFQVNSVKTIDPDTGEEKIVDITRNNETHGTEDATFEDGAAIVYDPQNLPMVALTKTTFDVPTMAEQEKDVQNAGKYLLADYLKIVGTDASTGEVKVYPVNNNGLDWSVSQNPGGVSRYSDKLAINTRTGKEGTAKLTINKAEAASDSSIAIMGPQEVSFTVRKTETGLWKASFADYKDSYLSAQNFMTNEAPDGTINAPAQSVSAPKQIALNQKLFDQYGQTYTGEETVSVAVKLFSDSGYSTDAPSDYANYVKINGTKLEIYKDLPTNVYCELKVYVTGQENNNDTLTKVRFMVESTKPHATSAEIVLKDVGGNQYMDSQGKPLYIFTIPAPGQNPVQIKIDAKILDQNKNEMTGSDKPGFTASASFGTTAITPGSTNGLSLSEDNTLTITSEALALLESATGRTTITVTVSVTGTNVTATETITLKKAQSVATKLATENSGWNYGEIRAGASDNMPLPGIGETSETPFTFLHLSVLDQYDTEITEVTCEHFKLYRAVVDNNDPAGILYSSGTDKYVKSTEIGASNATFSANANGVKLEITNAWDATKNQLAVPDGYYIVEATYPNPNNEDQPLVARCVIKLTKAPVPTTATVTASAETIYVPYASEYGALEEGKASEVTLTAKVEDQYGDSVSGAITMELDNPIYGVQCIALDGTNLTRDHAAFTGVTESNTVTVGLTNKAVQELKSELSTHSMTVKVKVKVGGTAVGDTQTVSVNVSREASALKKATVVMKQGETEVASEALTAAEYQKDVNLISPKTKTEYTFTVTGEDQYGDDMSVTYYLDGTTPGKFESSAATGGYKLTVYPDVEGEPVLRFTAGGLTWQWKMKFAKMQFVKGETGSEQITAKDMLNDSNIPRTYDGSTWGSILTAAKKTQTVYIKNEGEGNNTEVEAGSISYKVVSVDADGHETEITDTTAKANAGSYKIKVIYKKGDQTYDVCEKTFKIEPKEVRIVLDTGAKIEKEYDGTKNLPDNAADKLELTGKVGNDDVDIETGNLVFESKDVNASVDSETKLLVIGDVNIVAVTGTSLLSGDDADNYTASITGLTGKITKRTIVVTPKSSNEVNLTYGGDVAKKLASEYTTNIDALPTTCVKPTIEGSMKLTDTTSGADVTVYNAGTYNVALGDLSLTGASAGNYQLELASGTHTWTIGKKTIKFLLTCEREADYGVYGRELYGELETMIASTDAGSKNIKDLFDTSKLEFRGSAGRTTVAKTGDVVVDAGTYAVTAESLTLAMSNNYDVQDAQVQITVKKHTIVSDDIKQNGGTQSVTFSGERQTLTNYKVSFTYKDREITLAKNQDFAVLENSNTILDTSTRLKVKAAENSANYEGEATASWSWYILARSVSTDDIEVSQVNVPTYDGNEHQVEIAVNHIGHNKDEAWLKFFTVNNIYFRTGDKATDAGEHTLAFSLTGPYASGRDVDPSKRLCELRWTIEKSNEKPIGDQTANTKYGQPGSIEIAVPTGAAKGLATSNLSVSALTDNDQIVDGTPSATFENGKIVVNWKLRGDATTIGKSATLWVTVAKSDNYKEYSFKIIVTAAKKDAQDKFFIETEDGRSAYSYSEAGVLMQASGNQTDVTWSIDPSYQEYAEIIDGSYVKFKKPGTVVIKASAEETDTYAAAEQTYTLTITKGQVTITASSATMTANDPLPGFSATASGLNPKDSVSDVFQTLTATVSTDGKTAGTFRVTPNAVFKTGAKDWNEYYELSFVQGTLTVNPAVSVIDTILPTIIAGNGCANGYANCACESFYDLDASRWYHESVDWAYNLGLMNGTTKSTFGPNAAATRAQTWTMLARIAGQDTGRSVTWYEVGQKWAMNLGITDGTNPMGSLTREQLAAMLYRYVGSPAVNGTLTFTDSANVSAWARNAMIWAVQNGILDGVGGNRLNPKGTTTRAQAAAIFMRFSKLINK